MTLALSKSRVPMPPIIGARARHWPLQSAGAPRTKNQAITILPFMPG